MRGRKTRRIAEAELNLDSFLDIVANIVGVLIFITLFVATQAMNQKEVTIVAKSEQGENRNKTPRYIECREDGVVIYPSKEVVSKEQLQNPNSALQQLVKQIKNRKEQEYLIVALRPSGIDIFNQVRELVQGEGIDIGYEPIDSGWQLNIQGEVVNEKKKTTQN